MPARGNAAGSGKAIANVPPIARTLCQAVIICGHGLVFWAFEVQANPAIDHEADGNVGNHERIAGDMGPAGMREVLVQLTDFLRDLAAALRDEPGATAAR